MAGGKKAVIDITSDLLVDAHSVEAVVHDVHPAVLGGEHKQRHQGVENVVKIIFLIDPAILRKLTNDKIFLIHNTVPISFAACHTCKHCSLEVMFCEATSGPSQ